MQNGMKKHIILKRSGVKLVLIKWRFVNIYKAWI